MRCEQRSLITDPLNLQAVSLGIPLVGNMIISSDGGGEVLRRAELLRAGAARMRQKGYVTRNLCRRDAADRHCAEARNRGAGEGRRGKPGNAAGKAAPNRCWRLADPLSRRIQVSRGPALLSSAPKAAPADGGRRRGPAPVGFGLESSAACMARPVRGSRPHRRRH